MATDKDTPWYAVFPDVPWYSVLFTAILAVLATLAASRASAMPATSGSMVGGLITDTALFLPHALILFGILADMFTYQGVYSIPSLVGVISILANKILDYFWHGLSAVLDKAKKVAAAGTGGVPQRGGAVLNYKGCYVQGFEIDALRSEFSSQTLVVTATILSYYIMDLVLNKGWASAMASIIVGTAFFFMQVTSMASGGCFESTGMTTTVMTSVANGVLFGGIAYGVVQTYFPSRLPSGAIQTIPPGANDLKWSASKGCLVDKNGKCWTLDENGNAKEKCAGGNEDSTGEGATAGNCANNAVNEGASS
jgi:hypothetical protein